MDFIRILLILLLVFFLQFTIIENIPFFYGNLNLLFIVVVFYSLFCSSTKGIFSAIFLGVLHDSICTTTFGLFLFGYILISVLIYLAKDKFNVHNILSQMIVILFAFLVFKLIISWSIFLGQIDLVKKRLFFNFLLQLGYLILFSPIMFFLLLRSNKKTSI